LKGKVILRNWGKGNMIEFFILKSGEYYAGRKYKESIEANNSEN
jgi:hypothetical protein